MRKEVFPINLFDFPKEAFPEEITTVLEEDETIRIEKIVSCGQTTGWYDQEENEWVLLLKGEAELEFETHKRKLFAGDYIVIPKHSRHRVSFTTRCIWLCMFYR